jgi:hypothetical protein
VIVYQNGFQGAQIIYKKLMHSREFQLEGRKGSVGSKHTRIHAECPTYICMGNVQVTQAPRSLVSAGLWENQKNDPIQQPPQIAYQKSRNPKGLTRQEFTCI